MFGYILVFLAAAVPGLEIIIAIPVGIIKGMSPILVMLFAFLGNMVTVLAVIIGFQKIKDWMEARKNKDGKGDSKRTERGKRIWNKYGMPGLALLGPIFIGTHIAAFIGLLFGASKINTILWMTISIAVWSLVFGIATSMGFDFFTN
jgi:uncharacterized membrane protein